MNSSPKNIEQKDILNSLADLIEQENFKPSNNIKNGKTKSPILDENIENIIVNNEEKIIPKIFQNKPTQIITNEINFIGLSFHKQTLYFILFLIVIIIVLWLIYKNKLTKKEKTIKDDVEKDE